MNLGDARIAPASLRLRLAATLLLAAVRATLSCVPYRIATRLFARLSQRSRRADARTHDVGTIVNAVEHASVRIPGAEHCLTKAIATHILLARRGHPAELCIGVLPDPRSPFPAHAWVESGGVVVIGGADSAQRYLRLRSQPESAGNSR
jgi:hypothetical protein